MSATLDPNNELFLRNTNVSSPSIIQRSQSPHSVTASESYYSLSSGASSSRIAANDNRSTHTIHRYSTPPSRYRTPLQSRDNLTSINDSQVPLRGQGQRRYSADEAQVAGLASVRENTIRRKPVPSTVMEGHESQIDPTNARSSVALDMARSRDAPTPNVDDRPFIHFALDQITRDEEVRGSRVYMGPKPNQVEQNPVRGPVPAPAIDPVAAIAAAPQSLQPQPAQPLQHVADQQVREPPPRNPNRPMSAAGDAVPQPDQPKQIKQEPDVFLPLAPTPTQPLNFRPGILRPLALGLFLLLVLAYMALLLLSAIYSLIYTGMWGYGTIGDNRYFVFQYLPVLLGIMLLLWLFQIQAAVARISPFLAMSSSKPKSRLAGPDLPIYLGDFLLPSFLRYFKAGQPIIAVFMLIAWLQVFSIPLLSTCYNVYFVDTNWRWTAVQGIVWATFGLYLLLAIAIIMLIVHLARLETGLKWDPRSMADIIVMLERSNALEPESEIKHDPARLGLWRTSARPNDVFYTYGHANIEPRRYGVDGGRIKERPATAASADTHGSRWRHSKDAMLDNEAGIRGPGIAFPWFLRITFTMLWATIAIVLLLAFLIVSYLPSTNLFRGFNPDIGVIVSGLGFSAENFLYSFIPTILATLCLLFWINIDFAFRRYSPILSLLHEDGVLAERSLLLSYPADMPGLVSLAAASNGHFRTAWLSFNTLIAAAITILASGVFWAQFDVTTQKVLIYIHEPAFYALTVFVCIYALSYFLLLPFSHAERRLAIHTPHHANQVSTFADMIALVQNSKILSDFAFHDPISKVDLVTRLLSVQPGVKVENRQRIEEPNMSMQSLADSLRGFSNARGRAIGAALPGVPKYGISRWEGRNGNDFLGIDRFR